MPRACERPRDPRHPPACPGEPGRQLVAHAREALPARPGSAERWDYEYVRNGVADVLVAFAPLERERHARPARTRTRVDLAETLRWVSDDPFPEAEGIVLVWDNPSTHSMGSPCEAFPPGEAERLASRLKVRHTLRHVSRQLTEQGHPARAISPKPARARICRQRCSRSPQSIIQPIVPGTSPGPLM